ncbi:MAG: hypothetical protein AB4041_20965 [Microcystaceae cyanobacterium]
MVSEIYADGKWRLLDPDRQVYFHASENINEIYGVEDLVKDSSKFLNFISLTNKQNIIGYRTTYQDIVQSTDDNIILDSPLEKARDDYIIQNHLRPQEKIVFTNYNWGKYFLGSYPNRVPKYFNGYYEYKFLPHFISHQTSAIKILETETGFQVTNHSNTDHHRIKITNKYSFPIVGGSIDGEIKQLKGKGKIILEDLDNNLRSEYEITENINIYLENFVNIIAKRPTYQYSVIIELQPNASIEIDKDFTIISDFQFAELALLKLAEGQNSINIHYPNSELSNFSFNLYVHQH